MFEKIKETRRINNNKNIEYIQKHTRTTWLFIVFLSGLSFGFLYFLVFTNSNILLSSVLFSALCLTTSVILEISLCMKRTKINNGEI
jgi:hypothetical protein